jgi:hypothetical protein
VSESSLGCVADCSRCGDGYCAALERVETLIETAFWPGVGCNEDCARCGDNICSGDEVVSCPSDCPICGDFECSPGEQCPFDCDGSCDALHQCHNRLQLENGCPGCENCIPGAPEPIPCTGGCWEYCGSELTRCGSGYFWAFKCEGGGCPFDCGGAGCGDGACSTNEDSTSCAEDCPARCGNFVCEPGETTTSCAMDCRAP